MGELDAHCGRPCGALQETQACGKRACPMIQEQWAALSTLLVPPVAIRPSVAMDVGAGSNEDDLTVKLSEILTVNNIIRAALAGGKALTTHVMEDWEYLQLQCAMYINGANVPNVRPEWNSEKRSIRAFAQRLITQMYFEGDPLIWKCPIVNTIPDRAAVERLIAPLDLRNAIPMDALAYRFDIVLRGRRSTLFENRMEGL